MRLWLVICAALAGACGGGSGDPIDAPTDVDMFEGCTAGPDFGTATALDEDATHDPSTDVYLASFSLNADTDLLRLQLTNGVGVFDAGAGGLRTGTFAIAGEEAQYATCGLCVLLFANTSQTSLPDLDSPINVYLATSGSVHLDQVSPTLIGTVDDLVLRHVTIDRNQGFESTVVGDCMATITTLEFDVPVTEL